MVLHTKNTVGYSQWKEILKKEESLESVGVFLDFTSFSFSVDYFEIQVFSIGKQKPQSLLLKKLRGIF